MHITENKWRAVRYGIHGEMIDFGQEESIPFHFLMEELLEIVDDVVDDLDSRTEVEYVRTILRNGTSADRQVNVYLEHGGDDNREEALQAVVDSIVKETQEGL
jgi:carboxylate-amine ligase